MVHKRLKRCSTILLTKKTQSKTRDIITYPLGCLQCKEQTIQSVDKDMEKLGTCEKVQSLWAMVC